MTEVCVLMSTYNGEKYLKEQIDSIFKQVNVAPRLIIRDDGSSDGTIKIIHEINKVYPDIDVADSISGYHNGRGIGSNFFLLLRYAYNKYENIKYFSFSDQDDVWLENKLYRAIKLLSTKVQDYEKGLYFSRKRLVDADLRDLGSDVVVFHNDFSDFLSRNDAGGCTMVINREFAQMLLSVKIEDYPNLHDVAIEKIALCTDTKVLYDKNFESILYRQHGSNVTFEDKDFRLLKKNNFIKIFRKRRHFMKLIAGNILRDFNPYVLPDARTKLEMVVNYENPGNAMKLLIFYWKNKNRKFRDKIKFTGMVILHGI